MPRSPRRLARLRQALEHRQPGLTVVLENIHDPHNVSAILRSCDAVGVHGVELLYTIERFPRIGKKSSSSASKWVGTRRHTSVADCFATLRSEGFQILATRVGAGTRSLYDSSLSGPTAFVLGNEHRGVSDEAAEMADACIHIPMMGLIESLNVSVAAAVCLYEALRQRTTAGMYAVPQIPPDRLEELFHEWTVR
jgi:tRNA (guanosine-2'-O-)-methyltransferase